jgi:hypothetical protein
MLELLKAEYSYFAPMIKAFIKSLFFRQNITCKSLKYKLEDYCLLCNYGNSYIYLVIDRSSIYAKCYIAAYLQYIEDNTNEQILSNLRADKYNKIKIKYLKIAASILKPNIIYHIDAIQLLK